jgi:HEAT repeat protein
MRALPIKTLPGSFFLWLLLAFLQLSGVSGQSVSTEMERILEILAGYDFDESRSWMPDLQQLMKEVYNNSSTIDEIEPLIISFLESDATAAGKQYICRELGNMGTPRSVPALSTLLSDPGMAGTALLALEKIPGSEADHALLQALEEGDQDLQIAAVNSLAARQVAEAVLPLEKLLYSDHEPLTLAAVSALGSIGGIEAAGSLQEFAAVAPTPLKWEALDAMLRCAGRMTENGDARGAANIYAQVDQADPPLTLKYDALSGLFSMAAEDPCPFLSENLRLATTEFRPYIVRLIYRLDGSHALGRLFDDLPDAQPGLKSRLISALAAIGDLSVLPVVRASLMDQEEQEDVRLAALLALAGMGEPPDALLLAKLAAASGGAEKELARQGLYMLRGSATNDVIRTGIRENTGAIRAELIRSTGERNMAGTTGLLFELASDPDRNARLESIRALGKLSPPELLPDLITVLLQADTRRERQEAERAVFAVTQKMPENAKRSGPVIGALADARDPGAIASLVNIIGMIGDDEDLDVLRAQLASGEEEVQLTVIRAMSGWPDAGPMEDLKELASSTEDQRKHTLALRGYVAVVLADGQMSTDDKFSEIRQAFDLAGNVTESRIVMAGLGRIGSLAALDLAINLLDDPLLKREAEVAVARIAEDTGWGHPEETGRRLNAVLEKIENEEVRERIHRILERIN